MRRLNFALAALLLLLGATGAARADSFTCDNVPNSFNGDIEISQSGDCNIGHDVNATGSIFIHAGGNTTVGNVSAGSWIQMTADKLTVNGSITSPSQNIVVDVQHEIKVTGSVDASTTQPGGLAGAISISANRAFGPQDGTLEFVIGSSSDNGVAGSLNTNNISGGFDPANPLKFVGGVHVYNGGTGGISTPGSAISVASSQSRAGIILLESLGGDVTVTGNLQADGAAGQAAGFIAIQANNLNATSGETTISASDDGTAKKQHEVLIAATQVNYGGAGNTGLTIQANGTGASGGTDNALLTGPRQMISIIDTRSASGLDWTVFFTSSPIDRTSSPATFSGTGTGLLKLYANGDNSFLQVSGNPLKFTGGDVDMQAKGSGTLTSIGFTGSAASAAGLSFAGGKVTVNANGNKTATNIIDVHADRLAAGTSQVVLRSDGTGNQLVNGGFIKVALTGQSDMQQFRLSASGGPQQGDGGRIEITNPNGSVTFPAFVQADAVGNGKGGHIEITADKATFNSQAAVSAGALMSGDAGDVKVTTTTDLSVTNSSKIEAKRISSSAPPSTSLNSIELKSSKTMIIGANAVIDASASGNSGNGGNIAISAIGGLTIQGQGNQVRSDAAGSDQGGIITISDDSSSGTPLVIGNPNSTPIIISAAGGSSGGKGGTIKAVTSARPLKIGNANALTVAPGPDADAGTIFVKGFGLELGQNNTIRAEGIGSGKGGLVHAEDTSSNTTPVIIGGTSANGLSAKGGATGAGGRVEAITTARPLRISSAASLDVTSGTGRDGGEIFLQAFGLELGQNNTIRADGNGAGKGGLVHAEDTSTSTTALVFGGASSNAISAKGGTSGGGGRIEAITTARPLRIANANSFDVTAGTDGDGGDLFLKAFGLELGQNNTFRADSNGAGNGGLVHLEDTSTSTTNLTIGGANNDAISATGGLGGSGGTVEIIAMSRPLKIVGLSLAVTAGENADGGSITVQSDSLVLSGELHADGSGSGSGGTITLTPSTAMDMSNVDLLSAHGGEFGDGGSVEVLAGPFDVDAVINVDPEVSTCCAVAAMQLGPRVRVGDDGLKKLNGIPCRQHKQGVGWPRTYWNCAHPGLNDETSSDRETVAAANDALTSKLTDKLGADTIGLYVFNNLSDSDTAFDRHDGNLNGITFLRTKGNRTNIYSNVSEAGLSDANIREVTVHELGHAFDILLGRQSIASGPYNTYVQNDWFDLDYITTDGSTYTPRPACDGVKPPFANISAICTGTIVSPVYTGMRNSDILRALGPSTADGKPSYWFAEHIPEGETDPAWNELYAQVMAFVGIADPQSHFGYTVPDNVFKNGYFACSQKWANSVRNNGTVPVDACGTNHRATWYGDIN